MSELGAYWLKDLFDQQTASSLANYLGALNAYFFFEVISDNLAMGLARPDNSDKQWHVSKEILLHFNAAMQAKLSGSPELTFFLLSSLSEKINTISCFNQSLTSHEIKVFANSFLRLNSSWSLEDLDKAAMTYLILNIESCCYCLQLFPEQPQMSSLLLQSLNARYQAVTSLLEMKHPIQRSFLTQCGLYSILVIPTLLYLIGVLNKIKFNHHLLENINSGSLLKVLECAAINIRLLNDVGTHLLSMPPQEIDDLQQRILSDIGQDSSNKNIFSFLSYISKQPDFFNLFIRIRKDIEHQEFNVCLDNLDINQKLTSNITQFFDNVRFFANLYQDKKVELGKSFALINDLLQDDSIGQLIMRMVVFHERLYAQEFENNQGDYATHR
jgi:hypothetical protein